MEKIKNRSYKEMMIFKPYYQVKKNIAYGLC